MVKGRFESAASASGAIGVVCLTGDIDALLKRLDAKPVRPGEARVRSIAGVDALLAARWSERSMHLFPHGGRAVACALEACLQRAGVVFGPSDPQLEWPEASDAIEALMLETLAGAASPIAVDRLLRQPARWKAWLEAPETERESREAIEAHSGVLDRLLSPPVVAAIGASNIGKSSLLNALVRRDAALVADMPGTTRDFVGATLDLGGLVVRWLDCPGVRGGADEVERKARDAAEAAVRGAALVLSCADAAHDWLPDPPGAVALRVGLRSDLGERPGAEVRVSVRDGWGIRELCERIRERLVPVESLSYEGPWLFHPGLTTLLGFA